jgi:hypothetical protein
MPRGRPGPLNSSSSEVRSALTGSVPAWNETISFCADPFRGIRRSGRFGEAHSDASEGADGLSRAISELQRSKAAWRVPFRRDQSDSMPSETSDGLRGSIVEQHRTLPRRQKPARNGPGQDAFSSFRAGRRLDEAERCSLKTESSGQRLPGHPSARILSRPPAGGVFRHSVGEHGGKPCSPRLGGSRAD